MEWLQNLSKAIDYIEENLDKEISLEEAARIACYSPFYFKRMFACITGMSLSEYIRRRRMTQAAFELQRTDQKVIDIALKYGYASPSSFHRAFQAVHGISPAAARHAGSTLNAYPAVKFSVAVTGGTAMSFHVEQKEEIRIVGIRMPLCEDMEENHREVPGFWKKAFAEGKVREIASLSDQTPGEILGVSVYHGPQDFYYYIAAASKGPVPEGMYECVIPEAEWAVFENEGPFKENVQGIFRRFYTEWLPLSGYAYAELPDIEVYPADDGKPSAGHSEVWIAVKKEKED